jgi:hypothetical protein
LLDYRLSLLTSKDSARAKGGEGGKQRASLRGPRFMVDHRMGLHR